VNGEDLAAVNDDVGVLQAEFPAYLIRQEFVRGRTRYVAQRQGDGLGPHTVITPDIDELRRALRPARAARRAAVAAIELQAE